MMALQNAAICTGGVTANVTSSTMRFCAGSADITWCTRALNLVTAHAHTQKKHASNGGVKRGGALNGCRDGRRKGEITSKTHDYNCGGCDMVGESTGGGMVVTLLFARVVAFGLKARRRRKRLRW
jgi:hypothetical protein